MVCRMDIQWSLCFFPLSYQMHLENTMLKLPAIKMAGTQHCMAHSEGEIEKCMVHDTWKQEMGCELLVSWPSSSSFLEIFSVLSWSETWHWLERTLLFLAFYFHSSYKFTIQKLAMHCSFGNIRIEHAPLFIFACLVFFFFIRKFFVWNPVFFYHPC